MHDLINVRNAANSSMFNEKHWGVFAVIDRGKNYKVKRIEILPGKKLSFQRHAYRNESWTIVQGSGMVKLNHQQIIVLTGDTVEIPIGATHRIENLGKENLVFIEVQRGIYLGEDDIEPLEGNFIEND